MDTKEIGEIVDDPKKVADFKLALQGLLAHPGWKILMNSLKTDVAEIEAKLHKELKWEENETFDTLNDHRTDRLGLLNLPEYLMKIVEREKGVPKNLMTYIYE